MKTMDNISARFIIKFKDDFLLNEQLVQQWNIKISEPSYYENSSKYIERKKASNSNLGNHLEQNEYIDFTLLDTFMLNFSLKGLTINYLYYEHPISIFNTLLLKASDTEILRLANFYNYFDVSITQDYFGDNFEEMNNFIFEQLYPFEPIKSNARINFNNSPIEHIYIKGIPTFTESPSSLPATPVLIPEMMLPNSPINLDSRSVTLYDLEFAWDTIYPELLDNIENKTPFFPPTYRSIISTSGMYFNNYKIHGKKVLALLKSENNSVGINGLLTDSIEVKLSSVLTTPSGINLRTKEESSLLSCFYELSSPSKQAPQGSIILIEISTSPYPLEIQPAIFELIKLATTLKLVVIEGAGNDNKDFSTMVVLPTISNRPRPTVSSGNNDIDKLQESFTDYVNEYKSKIGTYPLIIWNTYSSIGIVTNFKTNNSGAIIIGAYSHDTSGQIIRYQFSNFDNNSIEDKRKVQIYAYGGGIIPDDNFEATSAASALIAAIAVAIQSHRKSGKQPLTSSQILSLLLNNTNYPCLNGKIPKWNLILPKINTI